MDTWHNPNPMPSLMVTAMKILEENSDIFTSAEDMDAVACNFCKLVYTLVDLRTATGSDVLSNPFRVGTIAERSPKLTMPFFSSRFNLRSYEPLTTAQLICMMKKVSLVAYSRGVCIRDPPEF